MQFFLIDFSIISHLSHFIDTSSESFTVKSHRYWINEIAMWNERSKMSVKHQWRCQVNHSTSRQCVAFDSRLYDNYSDEKYLLHSVSFQLILDICCRIDATSDEKRTQNIEALKTSMHFLDFETLANSWRFFFSHLSRIFEICHQFCMRIIWDSNFVIIATITVCISTSV